MAEEEELDETCPQQYYVAHLDRFMARNLRFSTTHDTSHSALPVPAAQARQE
jgi:hypothetical protein